MRLAPPRLGGRNPFERQAELLLIGEMMVDARLIVGGERDDQRALRRAVRRRCRTPVSSSAAKAGQRAWLSRPSATSASSPGSASQQAASMPAAAWLAPLPAAPRSNTVDGRAPRRQPPGDAKPDHAGADDGDLGRFGDCVRAGPSRGGSLRWHDPDRFDGCDLSRGPAAPQAVCLHNGHFGAVPQVRCQVGGGGGGGGGAWRNAGTASRRCAITMMTAAPRNISGSRLPCA